MRMSGALYDSFAHFRPRRNILMNMKKVSNSILWILVALYAIVSLVGPLHVLLIFLVIAFGLLHGARRYKWRGILAFLIICLVVSNILEITSITTGFPFGHYHYTDLVGPMIGVVPVTLGFAYFATGYLAWVLSTVLIGDVRRESSAFTTFAVPFIAAFIMVAWDLGFDPTMSTIQHDWIWEQGGGYFGVPLTNFLGWFFTAYVFFQLFALFLHIRKAGQDVPTLPRSYYAQAIMLYALIGLLVIVDYLTNGGSALVTDMAGIAWHTGSIAEAEALVTIFTMLFMAALSIVKLLQGSANASKA
jgi:putative membrane protein